MLSPFGALMNPPAACCAANEHGVVASLLADRSLRAHFQPIVRLADGVVFAHEALVRGPVGTPLQQPDALFKAAAEEGQTLRLENACVAVALKCWSAHAVGGKLFVKAPLSPEMKAGFAHFGFSEDEAEDDPFLGVKRIR